MDEIKEIKEPEKDPVEELKEEIYKQDDAVQYLVRPLKNNPFGNFSEEIIESRRLSKRVRIQYNYVDVSDGAGKVVGKSLCSYRNIVEDV